MLHAIRAKYNVSRHQSEIVPNITLKVNFAPITHLLSTRRISLGILWLEKFKKK